MAIDKAAEKLGASFTVEKFRAKVSETFVNGEKVLLLKPQTYMNLSGESVREVVDFFKVDLKDLLVVFDDFDLPKGAVRIRPNGSAGTHNGMRNIISLLSSEKFARIRIGFKSDNPFIAPIDYVLSEISKDDKPLFDTAINSAADAVIDFIKGVSTEDLMQKYNRK